MKRWRIVALVLVSASITLRAQEAPAPSFEVASVKQNTSGDLRAAIALPGPRPPGAPSLGPPDMLIATNAELRMLIWQAYGVPVGLQRFVVVGGSEKILSSRFDVRAKPPEGTPPAQAQPMLRALLEDRFKLRLHKETRQLPIYAIVVAREGKLGPEIRQSNYDCAALRAAGAQANDANKPLDAKGRDLCWRNQDFGASMGVRYAGPLSMLVSRAQAYVDRPLVDATGLTGNYEWQLTFTMKPSADADVPSIYTAFPEQLGLKLDARMGPFDVFVIDSVEMPMPD